MHLCPSELRLELAVEWCHAFLPQSNHTTLVVIMVMVMVRIVEDCLNHDTTQLMVVMVVVVMGVVMGVMMVVVVAQDVSPASPCLQ